MEKCIVDIKTITFDKGIFDEIVDCTYVFLCCGPKPPREESVHININKFRPTSTVKLIYNVGFKNCPITKSLSDDMASSQLYIFNDALKNNYQRILFLEDDFLVPEQPHQNDIDSITSFINTNSPSLYGLGNFIIPTPTTLLSSHQKPMFDFIPMSHAVIYDKHYMQKAIDYYKNHETKLFQDILPGYLSDIERYRYYKPLVFQIFPITENQKNGWNEIIPSKILLSIVIVLIKILQLDKNIYPGYSVIYIAPYIIYIIIIFIILFIIYKLFNKTQTTK